MSARTPSRPDTESKQDSVDLSTGRSVSHEEMTAQYHQIQEFVSEGDDELTNVQSKLLTKIEEVIQGLFRLMDKYNVDRGSELETLIVTQVLRTEEELNRIHNVQKNRKIICFTSKVAGLSKKVHQLKQMLMLRDLDTPPSPWMHKQMQEEMHDAVPVDKTDMSRTILESVWKHETKYCSTGPVKYSVLTLISPARIKELLERCTSEKEVSTLYGRVVSLYNKLKPPDSQSWKNGRERVEFNRCYTYWFPTTDTLFAIADYIEGVNGALIDMFAGVGMITDFLGTILRLRGYPGRIALCDKNPVRPDCQKIGAVELARAFHDSPEKTMEWLGLDPDWTPVWGFTMPPPGSKDPVKCLPFLTTGPILVAGEHGNMGNNIATQAFFDTLYQDYHQILDLPCHNWYGEYNRVISMSRTPVAKTYSGEVSSSDDDSETDTDDDSDSESDSPAEQKE